MLYLCPLILIPILSLNVNIFCAFIERSIFFQVGQGAHISQAFLFCFPNLSSLSPEDFGAQTDIWLCIDVEYGAEYDFDGAGRGEESRTRCLH